MTSPSPEVFLKYGELGVLFAVLLVVFWRITPKLLDALQGNSEAIKGNSEAITKLNSMLAEGEAKAVSRHHETREHVVEVVAEQLTRAALLVGTRLDLQTSELKAHAERVATGTRHDLRNAMLVTTNAMAEHADTLLRPVLQKQLGAAYRPTPSPFPQVKTPTPTGQPTPRRGPSEEG